MLEASTMTTVSDFFTLVQSGGTQVTADIESLFVNDNAGPPKVPNIGLTTGGPHFFYKAGLDDLFGSLKSTFTSWALNPNQNPPLELTNGVMTAVEATLKLGSVKKKWNPKAGATSPLSKIPATPGKSSTLPLCAVFTMDSKAANAKIRNLALYFDRWKLGQDLWDKKKPKRIDK
jgi:hypothetical protein